MCAVLQLHTYTKFCNVCLHSNIGLHFSLLHPVAAFRYTDLGLRPVYLAQRVAERWGARPGLVGKDLELVQEVEEYHIYIIRLTLTHCKI